MWQLYISDNPKRINNLLLDLESIFELSDNQINELIKTNSDGLSFDLPIESKMFLQEFYQFIKSV